MKQQHNSLIYTIACILVCMMALTQIACPLFSKDDSKDASASEAKTIMPKTGSKVAGQPAPKDDKLKSAKAIASPKTPRKPSAKDKKATLAEKIDKPDVTDAENTANLGPAPKIKIEPALLDMGLVPNDKPATAEFTVYNQGSADLRVTSIKPSCGCTKAEVEDKVIPPGGTTKLSVVLDLKKVHGFKTQKSVRVYSNDPTRKKKPTTVKFKCEVEPEFICIPEVLDFGKVAKGTEVEKAVMIRQACETPLEITKVGGHSPSQRLTFSYEKRPRSEWADEDRAEYIILAKLLPDATSGKFRESINITTNISRLKNFRYMTSGNIEAFYTVTPKGRLNLRFKPGETEEGAVKITADRPFDISNIEMILTNNDKDVFETVVRKGENPNEMFIDVVTPKEIEARGIRGSLRFAVKSDGKELYENMPLYGYLNRGSKKGAKPVNLRNKRPGRAQLHEKPTAPIPTTKK